MLEKIEKQIANYCRWHFQKISVESWGYLANARCHHNSKQALEDGKCNKIAMVVMIHNKEEVICHFLPKKGKKYFENTLGYTCKNHEYYLVKDLDKTETDDMDQVLGNFKEQLLKSSLNPVELVLFRILGGGV